MNTADAAYHTVHDYPGGSESLGPRVDISAAVLRNKVNPNNTTHHLTLAEAQRIAAMTGDHRMLQAWAHAEGYLLVKAPAAGAESSDAAVLEQVASMLMDQGQFAASINAALADGDVNQAEMQEITAAAQKFMTSIVNIKQRMSGMVR